MRKKVMIVGVALLIAVCCSAEMAIAQIMSTQPVAAILKSLRTQGYVAVRRIELKEGAYWVTALNDEGESVDLQINIHNGAITTMKKTDLHISMEDVVAKIEAVGYTGITLIEAEDNHYEVIAIGPNGKRTHLKIDAVTGGITKFVQ